MNYYIKYIDERICYTAFMKERMQTVIHPKVDSFNNLRDCVLEILEAERRAADQIGYVAGIISSEGDEHIQRNIRRLRAFTDHIRDKQNHPVFSSTDIFTDGVFDQLRIFDMVPAEREQRFIQFWRGVVGSGYVTDIFMTPRWDMSRGAQDEHETAVRSGITIHYVEQDVIVPE